MSHPRGPLRHDQVCDLFDGAWRTARQGNRSASLPCAQVLEWVGAANFNLVNKTVPQCYFDLIRLIGNCHLFEFAVGTIEPAPSPQAMVIAGVLSRNGSMVTSTLVPQEHSTSKTSGSEKPEKEPTEVRDTGHWHLLLAVLCKIRSLPYLCCAGRSKAWPRCCSSRPDLRWLACPSWTQQACEGERVNKKL